MSRQMDNLAIEELEWEYADELLFLITESSRYKIAHVCRTVIYS